MLTKDRLSDLRERIRSARSSVDQEIGKALAVRDQGLKVQAEVETLTAQKASYEKAAAVLGSIGEQRQQAAQGQVEALVTRGLQTVFGEEYSFHIEQSMAGLRPEVNFLVRSTMEDGTVIETDVMSSRGGGLAAVVGFLLRVVIALLSKKADETVIFLDETFGMLSEEYEGRMAEFIRELSDKTGLSFVLVTHSSAYSDLADKRYRFELSKKGTTIVKEV
jgi:DNA repair exonuclease SbcCD ATPase subunit